MRKNPIIAVIIAAVLILSSCATNTATWDKAPSKSIDVSYYEEYMTPWKVNAPEVALQDGNLHFWFMASMGLKMEVSSTITGKWGDSCLVVFPSGKTMLIDTGHLSFIPLLALNLERMGVTHLDYVLISHPHADHASGIYRTNGLFQYFDIGELFISGVYNSGLSPSNIIEQKCEANGTKCTLLEEGDKLEIEGVSFTILNPTKEETGTTVTGDTAVNNASLVVRMDYGQNSALFPGDIYAEREAELIARYKDTGLLDVDLLKVPHHGHNTSSTKAFAEAVTPKIAVATGYYGPMEKTYYSNYTRTGAKVLLDYLDGYIHVTMDGNDISLDTSMQRATNYYSLLEYGSPYLL